MSVRAFFRRLRAIVSRAGGGDGRESAEDAQLAAIQREVERGLDALRRAQEEHAASCKGAGSALAGPARPEAQTRSSGAGG